MATKVKEEMNLGPLTIRSIAKEKKEDEPTVDIFIPALEDSGDGGMKVDQYEHVSLSNEVEENVTFVLRGERVPVKVPVFCALKARYPKI